MTQSDAFQKCPSTPRRAILYAADETNGRSVAAMLRKAGYEVLTTAHSGRVLKALEGTHPPELLVADIVTPPGHVNGLAMARMARVKCPGLKVIYTSGYAIADLEDGLRGPLLHKPIAEEALLAAVREVIDDPQ